MSTLGPSTQKTPSPDGGSRDVRAFARGIRRIVLEQSMRAGVGHIGSALSVADIVTALYADDPPDRRPARPRSRPVRAVEGARESAVYAALHLRDLADARAALDVLRGRDAARDAPGGRRSGHRLRHRLARARSLARRGRRARGAPPRLEKASVLPPQRRRVQRGVGLGGGHVCRAPRPLRTLVAIVDLNGQQALGYTKDVLDLSPDGRPLARVRLGRPRRRRPRPGRALRASRTHSTTRRDRPTSSSPTRSSARASRSWRTASSGTTCR